MSSYVVGGNTGASGVKFKFDRMEDLSGTGRIYQNLLLVTPSSGTAPAQVRVGPNPEVIKTMRPGRYGGIMIFTSVDEMPPRIISSWFVILNLMGPPPAKIGAVVNAISARGAIAPGMPVSIFGSNLGPPVLSSPYDSAGVYPTEWGYTKVTFNGIAAPVLYVSPDQMNVIAPFALAGKTTAEIVVTPYSAGGNFLCCKS